MPADTTGYVHEKLSEAFRTLATGVGRIHERMLDAFAPIGTLHPSDFPEELRQDFADLSERATAVEAEGDERKIAATLARMSEEEIVDLANTIIRLEYQVGEILAASR